MVVFQDWRHGGGGGVGEEVGRVGLRAISGVRCDDHLKGNSGFLCSRVST